MTTSTGEATAAADNWTVQRILEWTTGFLKQKGVESPRLEAELLLAHARRCPRIRLYTDFNELLSDSERTAMRELVQRRARREPLAYIVGAREFYGQPFEIAQGVLVPRPETESLVDECLERIPKDRPFRLIEVGIGSGCIAVTLARLRPLCQIVATDISPRAIEIAQKNAERHGVADRIRILGGDTLQPLLDKAQGSPAGFHGLVSNPPYIRDDERSGLAPEVVQHEPEEALFSGPDGLNVVRRILQDCRTVLAPGAFVSLELDPAQCGPVQSLLQQTGFATTTCRRDLSGHDRIVTGILPEES